MLPTAGNHGIPTIANIETHYIVSTTQGQLVITDAADKQRIAVASNQCVSTNTAQQQLIATRIDALRAVGM